MKTTKGNLLDIPEGILVHQVNTLGVMGGGIALQIKNKWPTLFRAYQLLCDEGEINIGDVFFHHEQENLIIANLFGQKFLGNGATIYEAYDIGLPEILEVSRSQNLPIYFPYKIGCGLAGGDWNIVLGKIEKYCPDATIVEYIQ